MGEDKSCFLRVQSIITKKDRNHLFKKQSISMITTILSSSQIALQSLITAVLNHTRLRNVHTEC